MIEDADLKKNPAFIRSSLTGITQEHYVLLQYLCVPFATPPPRITDRLVITSGDYTLDFRTSAGCTTPLEVVTRFRQGAVAVYFLFNFTIDDIMRGSVDQYALVVILAPSAP
ncbi:hypothetical protein RB195_003240 [Necator americanus]|uniref:Uncharacterized protein n=1 Tax=Necator americanus TaxID=51031 RepID=A0ABR1DN22_NECAM